MPRFDLHEWEIEDVEVEAATETAILISTEDGLEVWLQRSQLQDGTTVSQKGDTGSVVLLKSLAIRVELCER